MSSPSHIPVLAETIAEYLPPTAGSRLLDLTLGLGGHTNNYLTSNPDTTAVGLDADPQAASVAQDNLAHVGDRVQIIVGNFANLKLLLAQADIPSGFHHILLDLGIGSHQLGDSDRGFSFQAKAPLRMLYGQPTSLPPSDFEPLNVLERRQGRYPDTDDVIQFLSIDDLATLIRRLGEERYAGRIARAIKESKDSITTSRQLADVIAGSVPGAYRHGRINPATRTFQALRLAVNRELEALTAALPQAVDSLLPGGRLAVISFHSLEDRIVKHFYRRQAQKCICPQAQPICTCSHQPNLDIITNKPIRPTEVETKQNPRSRSAKLRVAQKRP